MGWQEWKPILEGRSESPNAEMCLWGGKWVRLTQGTIVWVLSSVSVFKLLIIPKSRGTIPSVRVHRVLGLPLGLLFAHI